MGLQVSPPPPPPPPLLFPLAFSRTSFSDSLLEDSLKLPTPGYGRGLQIYAPLRAALSLTSLSGSLIEEGLELPLLRAKDSCSPLPSYWINNIGLKQDRSGCQCNSR